MQSCLSVFVFIAIQIARGIIMYMYDLSDETISVPTKLEIKARNQLRTSFSTQSAMLSNITVILVFMTSGATYVQSPRSLKQQFFSTQGRCHLSGWSRFHQTTFRGTENFIKPRRAMSCSISHTLSQLRACSARIVHGAAHTTVVTTADACSE